MNPGHVVNAFPGRIAIATQLVRILAAFGIVVTVIDYLQGNRLASGASSLITLGSLLILHLRKQPRWADLPLHFCTWTLFAMCLFGNLWLLPFYPEKAVWATIFPFAYFYLTGLRQGMVWVGACLLSMLLSYPLAPLLFERPLVLTPYAFSQAVGAFLLSALFAYLYERIRIRQAEQLESSAAHDHLTGLLNRRGFASLSATLHQQAERFGQSFAIVLLDVDNFKQVNDRLGHAVGDSLLVELAGVLTQHSRKADLVARWGGEEFILLLAQTSGDSAQAAAEKMRAAIAAHPLAHGPASASFGLAVHAPGESLEATIKRADAALYRAKESGKNCVVLAPPA